MTTKETAPSITSPMIMRLFTKPTVFDSALNRLTDGDKDGAKDVGEADGKLDGGVDGSTNNPLRRICTFSKIAFSVGSSFFKEVTYVVIKSFSKGLDNISSGIAVSSLPLMVNSR